ncbi:MBL fold metallo-hydrolase [uncultured Lentibacter sp.]|uniref:MBL fold metallo-hydrolase n=1 Tax=uncultured Lentibacter sp. TaxID=1659309 RepID=UPI0026288832|nr:MBL fold metallo-hydrolase [uncultured Lentibacter sp.]
MDDLTRFNPPVGQAEQLEPNLRRVLANNPSPMTYRGTNTYLLGQGDIAVIDPGPDNSAHLDAILGGLKTGETITHIFVTHSHIDHSPLAAALSKATGAPVLAYGDSRAGQSQIMQRLAQDGLAGGGEGVDPDFAPDILLQDGETVEGASWALTALHTPGHFGNHLAFAWGTALFSGDLVMGWASSLVSPPDGDLSDFMASCARLAAGNWRVFHAGHGAPVTNPAERLAWLISHRQSREAQILAALKRHPASAKSLTAEIYRDTPAALLPAAERNVFAHLVDLVQKSQITAAPTLCPTAEFALC